jgi:prevent-host-death family protein
VALCGRPSRYEELRRNLSQIISRAAYGIAPVLITRRGSTIAAVISMDDFILLEKARRRMERLLEGYV